MVDTTEDVDVARLRGVVASGGLVAQTRRTEPFRRRGIAAALLTRQGSSVGITTPFLTPEGDAEERIYRRTGYTCTTEILHISR